MKQSALGIRFSTAERMARRFPLPPSMSPMTPFTATATDVIAAGALAPATAASLRLLREKTGLRELKILWNGKARVFLEKEKDSRSWQLTLKKMRQTFWLWIGSKGTKSYKHTSCQSEKVGWFCWVFLFWDETCWLSCFRLFCWKYII